MGRPKNTKGKTRALEAGEIKTLLSVASVSRNSLRNVMLIKFMLYTGCRVGEACKVKVEDVFNGVGILPRINFTETKNKKSRSIPMSKRLQKELYVYLQSIDCKPEKPLFQSQKGSFLHPTYGSQLIKDLLTKAGLKDAKGSHALRRSCLVSMMEAGHSLATLKEISGHSNISTLNYYLSSSDERINNAVNSLKF